MRAQILEGGGTNAQSLSDVDSAIFALCLEREVHRPPAHHPAARLPSYSLERSRPPSTLVLDLALRDCFAPHRVFTPCPTAVARVHGWQAPVDDIAVSRCFLHGDGVDRWYDKSFQMLISANGKAALNFEHAWGDGVAVPSRQLCPTLPCTPYSRAPHLRTLLAAARNAAHHNSPPRLIHSSTFTITGASLLQRGLRHRRIVTCRRLARHARHAAHAAPFRADSERQGGGRSGQGDVWGDDRQHGPRCLSHRGAQLEAAQERPPLPRWSDADGLPAGPRSHARRTAPIDVRAHPPYFQLSPTCSPPTLCRLLGWLDSPRIPILHPPPPTPTQV